MFFLRCNLCTLAIINATLPVEEENARLIHCANPADLCPETSTVEDESGGSMDEADELTPLQTDGLAQNMAQQHPCKSILIPTFLTVNI